MRTTWTSVAELVDETHEFDAASRAAAAALARSKPWRGTVEERQDKFLAACPALAAALGIRTPELRFDGLDGSGSETSNVAPGGSVGGITLKGRLSVVTFFWCLAARAGRLDAMAWAVNLFRVEFPLSFSRCDLSGEYVRNPSRAGIV
jgi:hypothetical protein